jgi:redox-sensitive bicupin YhaK (pirin superfamily)
MKGRKAQEAGIPYWLREWVKSPPKRTVVQHPHCGIETVTLLISMVMASMAEG